MASILLNNSSRSNRQQSPSITTGSSSTSIRNMKRSLPGRSCLCRQTTTMTTTTDNHGHEYNCDCDCTSSSSSTTKQHYQQQHHKSVHFPDHHDELVQVAVCDGDSNEHDDDDSSRDQRQQQHHHLLWYSRSDFQLAKSTAKVIAQESARYGHSRCLNDTYDNTNNEGVECDDDERRKQRQNQLNLWTLHGHSRRGLERWANSIHGDIRKGDQYQYQQAVLRTQHQLKQLRLGGDIHSTTSCSSSLIAAEKLRRVSVNMSGPARQFAQMMGEADAHAAQWEYRDIHTASSRSGSYDMIAGQNQPSNKSLVGLFSSSPPFVDVGDQPSVRGNRVTCPPPHQRLFNRVVDLPRTTSSSSSSSLSASSSSHTTSRRTMITPRFTIRTASRSTASRRARPAARMA